MSDSGIVVGAILAGVGGVGLGIGLVVGAFVARMLRKYMKDEGLNGKN